MTNLFISLASEFLMLIFLLAFSIMMMFGDPRDSSAKIFVKIFSLTIIPIPALIVVYLLLYFSPNFI